MEIIVLALSLCADPRPAPQTPDVNTVPGLNPGISKPERPVAKTIDTTPPKYRFANINDYCWICPDSGRGPKDGIR